MAGNIFDLGQTGKEKLRKLKMEPKGQKKAGHGDACPALVG
jgi:hypothetical protein